MKMLSFCGIDVSKDRLDVIVLPEEQRSSVSNNRAGWTDLVERLRGGSIAAIGQGEQLVRYIQTERLGSLEVDHQFELSRLHHG